MTRAAFPPDEIRNRLHGVDAKALAKQIGHNHTTVWRFLTGKTKRPAWELVKALQDYLEAP